MIALKSTGAWPILMAVILGTLLMAAALVALACGSSATPVVVERVVEKEVPAKVAARPTSVTVTDVAGRTVSVKWPVERVILGRERQMYIIAALEPEEPFRRIVGRPDDLEGFDPGTYNKYLQKDPAIENIPRVGHVRRGDFSVEEAIQLRPDVFILNLDVMERAREAGVIDQLEKTGIPTVVIDFRRKPLENTIPSILLLGRLWDREERAQQIVDFYLEQVNVVYFRVDNIEKPKPTVLIDRAPGIRESPCCFTYGTVGLGLLVEAAGGVNIGSKLLPGLFGNINPEQVFVEQPDEIIVTGGDWRSIARTEEPYFVPVGYTASPEEARAALRKLIERRPGWETLKAVKNGGVHAIWQAFYTSPYDFVALQQFAKWLYPEEFQDLDPTATFREFHEKFLPIDYSGTFWVTLGK